MPCGNWVRPLFSFDAASLAHTRFSRAFLLSIRVEIALRNASTGTFNLNGKAIQSPQGQYRNLEQPPIHVRTLTITAAMPRPHQNAPDDRAIFGGPRRLTPQRIKIAALPSHQLTRLSTSYSGAACAAPSQSAGSVCTPSSICASPPPSTSGAGDMPQPTAGMEEANHKQL